MNATEIRKGMVIIHENELYLVHDFQHVAPGNWRAMVQTKLRHLKRGNMIQHRFRSTDKIEVAYLEKKKCQYLYREGDRFCLMDLETYDQIFLNEEQAGDAKNFLISELEVELTFYEGQVIGIELPTTVNLKVTETEPGAKGDTVTNVTKAATLETGLVVKVPLFINKGELLKVDTRTGEFLGRAN
ncbi:MAG: elongation factor P [Planctomycetes bacterium]|nr:elongation factor P [Planctomycetota bacterium]